MLAQGLYDEGRFVVIAPARISAARRRRELQWARYVCCRSVNAPLRCPPAAHEKPDSAGFQSFTAQLDDSLALAEPCPRCFDKGSSQWRRTVPSFVSTCS